jgi:hypothetical protein
MNCIKKLPWSAGTYKADKKYYPQDRVFCDGSVFASLREQTGNKPEVTVGADGSYTVTEGWMLLAPGNTESGSGVSDYNLLENRPSVNGHVLEGDQTAEELGLVGSRSVSAVVALTSVEYNSLKEKDPSTLYVITGGSGDED